MKYMTDPLERAIWLVQQGEPVAGYPENNLSALQLVDEETTGITLALNGAGGTAAAWFEQTQTSGNGGNGINVDETYNGTVQVGGQYLVSQNNTGNGVRLVMSGLGGVPVLDFGGGLLGSVGQSSIFGNGNRDFRYNNGGAATVMAENNWWGIDPPVNGQFAGSIDRNPWLTSDPNAP